MTQDEIIKFEKIATSLSVKLSRDLMALGDIQTKTTRIEFKGGTWPNNEVAMGGMNEDALARFFKEILNKYLPTEFANILDSKSQPTHSQSEPVACVTYKQITSNGATTTDTDLCITPYKSVNELGIGTLLYTKPQPTNHDVLNAKRYRYIRDAGASFTTGLYTDNEKDHDVCEWAMDSAIDDAMKESK